jgi:anti-sigma regulatory factor (Ser/Thr protein kinase)
MSDSVNAVVPCRIEFLDGIVALLETLCSGLDPTVACQIVTALNEAFSNVVHHSQLDETDPIEVRARRDMKQMTLTVIDSGVNYGELYQSGEPEEGLPSLSESGMGLYIIRQFMHEVTYERDERNKLSMIRYLDRDLEGA